MKPLLIAGILSAWMIDQANAQVYYSYPEWNRLDDSARAIYIAGAYDSLVSIASSDTAPASRHYSKCVASSRLTSEQLAKKCPHIRGYTLRFAKRTGPRWAR